MLAVDDCAMQHEQRNPVCTMLSHTFAVGSRGTDTASSSAAKCRKNTESSAFYSIEDLSGEWRSGEKVKTFTARNLANALWAMAKMGYHPGEELLEKIQGQVLQKLPEFNPQNLANTLWAFATLGESLSSVISKYWENNLYSMIIWRGKLSSPFIMIRWASAWRMFHQSQHVQTGVISPFETC